MLVLLLSVVVSKNPHNDVIMNRVLDKENDIVCDVMCKQVNQFICRVFLFKSINQRNTGKKQRCKSSSVKKSVCKVYGESILDGSSLKNLYLFERGCQGS